MRIMLKKGGNMADVLPVGVYLCCEECYMRALAGTGNQPDPCRYRFPGQCALLEFGEIADVDSLEVEAYIVPHCPWCHSSSVQPGDSIELGNLENV